MATVTLRGRFPKGTRVRLVEVKDESVLRSEGGKLIDVKKVGDDGVSFSRGVKDGQRYMLVGHVNGRLLEVRATGRKDADAASEVSQQPIQPDRVRLSNGSWADEAPEKESVPSAAEVSAPSQQQARKVVQRSSTDRGQATPQDVKEQLPYPEQGSLKKGAVQMSDTPRGKATPVSATPERQDQVPDGVFQRSATPVGVSTVIPPTDAVRAQQEKESAVGKAMRGEPGRVAAEPLGVEKGDRKTVPAAGEDDDQVSRDESPTEPDGDESGSSKADGTSVDGAKGADAVKASAGGGKAAKKTAKRSSTSKRASARKTTKKGK